jgi:hypothetical protein
MRHANISNHFALSPPLPAADRVGVDVHGDIAVILPAEKATPVSAGVA